MFTRILSKVFPPRPGRFTYEEIIQIEIKEAVRSGVLPIIKVVEGEGCSTASIKAYRDGIDRVKKEEANVFE